MAKQTLFIPGPVTCAQAVLAATARPMINHRGPEFARLLHRCARGMQPIFGTRGEIVFLGGSGTSGLEAAVVNAFSAGERVLSCPVGVFGRRLAAVARTYGLDVDVLETANGSAVDPTALRARIAAAGERPYAGVLLTHNETSTGVENDMAALSAALGEYPGLRIVDSVSGLGASAFETDAWGYDMVVTATQKALAAPPGLAMVAVSAKAWARMESVTLPRFSLDLKKAREFAVDGQTPWTPPVSIVYALDAALDLYEAEGAPAVWARHARYSTAVRAAVEALGLALFSQPGAHSTTVVAMHLPAGVDGGKLNKTLRETYGIVMGGGQAEMKGKIARMGVMGDLTPADILGALGALELALAEQGAAIDLGAGVRAAARSFRDADASTAAPRLAVAR